MTALTPSSMRAMRGAAGWSMRDLAAAADVALATVLSMEKGIGVSARTAAKVRAAFRAQGVTIGQNGTALGVRIAAVMPHERRTIGPACLLGLPYVVARPRADGTHRVLFEVPARLRPDGWPPVRPLPLTYPRNGNMADKAEVATIRADAANLMGQLERARTAAAEDRR